MADKCRISVSDGHEFTIGVTFMRYILINLIDNISRLIDAIWNRTTGNPCNSLSSSLVIGQNTPAIV